MRMADVSPVGMVGVVSRHLEPIPGAGDDDVEAFGVDDEEPLRRSAWWRWVAIIVALAMVIATPFAYVLSRLLT
jgi:hypothetical protein